MPLVNVIGLLFQILDDYKNLSSPTYTHNKGLCEDLTEGKFSFPVIHSVRSNPSNRILINILKQKTDDVEVKKYAVSYMEKTGSFEYTRVVMEDLCHRAVEMVEKMDAELEGDGLGKGKGEGIRRILGKMKAEERQAT